MGLIKNGPGHSGHGTLKQALSQEGINEITDFFNAVINSEKLEVRPTIFGKGVVPNGHGHLWYWALKLAVYEEGIDRIN